MSRLGALLHAEGGKDVADAIHSGGDVAVGSAVGLTVAQCRHGALAVHLGGPPADVGHESAEVVCIRPSRPTSRARDCTEGTSALRVGDWQATPAHVMAALQRCRLRLASKPERRRGRRALR